MRRSMVGRGLLLLSSSVVATACGNESPTRTTGVEVEALRKSPSYMTYQAPAGDRRASRDTVVDGVRVAILPNGRLLTPSGSEVTVLAPKPFGMAISPDGRVVATVNSGAGPFSVSLIRGLGSAAPDVKRIVLDAAFMGIAFSPDGSRFYVAGGENGNLWIGDTARNAIVGSVNLNGREHPLDRPLSVATAPVQRFKGAFPGRLVVSSDGQYLYVVDQASFQVHVIDTSLVAVGVDAAGNVSEPDNFDAVVNRIAVGRFPFGIALAENDRTLLVSNVGLFQYTHLMPATPTGDPNVDYPLCYPGVGYPDETEADQQIRITPVDPRALPESRIDAAGIRCGYTGAPRDYTVPGLGDPNADPSSSVYIIDVRYPTAARLRKVVKPGPLVGERSDGIAAFGGSHPNAIVIGSEFAYVSVGNDDTIAIYRRRNWQKVGEVSLSQLPGADHRLKGVQPVDLALSPDERNLYVAEAGLNAVGVLSLRGPVAELEGHIPVGWWPSAVRVSRDGKTLYVDNVGSPKVSAMGTVNAIAIPSRHELGRLSARVMENNGFQRAAAREGGDGPIPRRPGEASKTIRHVVFINKENSTHDQMLGDITVTRRGEPVDGEPRYSLGAGASPNHHELALSFTLGDNFYLEPTVSSDGHRWLTNTYTTELEETHWPASYGGRRRDSGDDPAVFRPYPGRLGFTDANGSPDPNDYNEHGSIYEHLSRHGKSFVNFGNGFEFALVDEDGGTEPTGIRQHVNVPMEKVLRDNSDHLYPEYNTHIPDAPLAEDPGRFSRFGRFKQVFEAEYVDRANDTCSLPAYVDLYYPNDHGGGPRDINPNGPDWSYQRYVQDNDAALGLTVELISHSPCWKDTVIFVVEDDTQNGLDHVDGYRSLFLAIGPWVKREHVSHQHSSLASIFKTTDLILGIPPLNQYDAAATDLSELFTDTPDLRPYDTAPITYAARPNATWRRLTRNIDFTRPDADEAKLHRAIMASEGLPRRAARRTGAR
jgi:DNA-binding beta-propeller fold protein YncE